MDGDMVWSVQRENPPSWNQKTLSRLSEKLFKSLSSVVFIREIFNHYKIPFYANFEPIISTLSTATTSTSFLCHWRSNQMVQNYATNSAVSWESRRKIVYQSNISAIDIIIISHIFLFLRTNRVHPSLIPPQSFSSHVWRFVSPTSTDYRCDKENRLYITCYQVEYNHS